MAVVHQPPPPNSDASGVVEYLQLAGRRYNEHVALLREEQAVREAQRAPFRPHISAHAERVGRTALARQSTTIGTRLHELHERRLALLEEGAQDEARRRAAAEKADCSFAPAVTARATRSRRSDGDVATALTRWGEQRRARQARAQVDATRHELSTVSATPRITAYAEEKARGERGRVSVEVSLTAEAEARRQRRHAAFEDAYPTAAPSPRSSRAASPRRFFAPAISALASRMEFEEDVVARLYERRGDAAPSARLYDEEGALHCTFRPTLSALSARLSRRHYAEEGEADSRPCDRLFRNTRHTSKFRKPAQPTAAGGQPEISETSRRMVEERRRRLALDGGGGAGAAGHNSGADSRAGAAAAGTAKTAKKRVVTARDLEERTAFTFAPSVSRASDALWRQRVTALRASGAVRNAEEARQLLWRKTEKQREAEVARLQEQRRRQEAAECTFRPKAGRPPRRRSGDAAMPVEARAALWARQRDRRLADLRLEKDAATAVECSFQPHVDPVFPLPRGDAAPAWGVETFLERQSEARRQRAEAEQWWRPQYARTPTTTADTTHQSHRRSPRGRSAGDATPHSRAASAPRSYAGSDTAEEEEEESFQQHWAAPPPASTSLTASSFSRVSQRDVQSADSSPPYAMRQPPRAVTAHGGAGPYMWRPAAAATASATNDDNGVGSAHGASATPSWRRPLRYQPTATAAAMPRARSAAL
ncbi:hypothetical protein NESM_000644000 [Novymonas esmeraldas]|uniref:200 kDa antigen p200 n=1 Tax=Novymonas esmeraldas TaxID=1808958 RepID=A0AAW0ETG8_9TRYP